MELPEIEQMVGEAENRVERLRSLYDQYFMGIERIEPQVARKDVERRIQLLRKTQIRNTALRFRFQNVVLRYNTFSAHWMRICRQIEEGTYKHHLRKAKERFDPLEAARESREARKKAAALEYGDTEPPEAPSFDVMEDVDVDFELDDPVDRPETRAALRSYAIPTDVVAPSVAGRAMASMSKEPPVAPAPPRRDGSLDRAPGAPPRVPPARASILDKKTDPAPPPVAAVSVKAPPPPRLPGAPPAPGRPPPVPVRPGALPVPPGAKAHAPPPVPQAPKPPPPPAAKATKPAPPPAAKPAPKAPPAAGSAPKPVAAQAKAPSVDDKTRQIYAKYVETRRSLGESTATITMDGLAKSLRDSSEKLRQKHPGKAVDFEVQVKDGKTVLKPIVR